MDLDVPDPVSPGVPDFAIRPARIEDAEALVNLVRELAVYEKLEEFAVATPESFRRNLFGSRPYAETFVAEVGGVVVGLAMAFPTFSTFRAQPGLYLEDLYVQPAHRGRGIGKALLATLAKLTRDRGFGRLEWSVLDWNAPSIGFYRSLGARPMDEWTIYRIDDAALERLATTAPPIARGEEGHRAD
ncbi:GNAT family N-acetyltransferase [Aquisphaera insulae]|uniref:GNAT family N-acetyltransferase n=1 Tax=Aquisphaera insulae TaxID=2712864 RepID=UPI0013EB314A|nr:GNAT family N-acetyltransferase [Aquisphaera insulae]